MRSDRSNKILGVLIDVIEEGVDSDYHLTSCKFRNVKSDDFKKLSSNEMKDIQNSPRLLEAIKLLCKYVQDDLEESEKK